MGKLYRMAEKYILKVGFAMKPHTHINTSFALRVGVFMAKQNCGIRSLDTFVVYSVWSCIFSPLWSSDLKCTRERTVFFAPMQ